MSEASSTRLNKFIARQTGISRREADNMIDAGRVELNGEKAGQGVQVHADDIVSLDGKVITHDSPATTILFHKPVDYVCSRRRQGESETIYALLPPEYQVLKAVGRLDRDSSGILLLTNDGDLAHRMTHPSFHKKKGYEVVLDSPLQPLHRQMISDYGVELEDGTSQFELERLETDQAQDTHWRIIMHEGRNRQIRRTFTALGYQVNALHRTNFGDYALGDISPGCFVRADIS